MSWLEQRSSGGFHIVFRLGGERFKRSLKTTKRNVAESRQVRLEENLRLLDPGRLEIPCGADVAAFLLSDGKLNGKPTVRRATALADLSRDYFESLPDGCMEQNSLYTAKIHLAHFERILGKRFSVGELKHAVFCLGWTLSVIYVLELGTTSIGERYDQLRQNTSDIRVPRTRPRRGA